MLSPLRQAVTIFDPQDSKLITVTVTVTVTDVTITVIDLYLPIQAANRPYKLTADD